MGDEARPGGAAGDGRGEAEGTRGVEEPVWLVRIILVLFLVAFAGFLAREVYNVVRSLS